MAHRPTVICALSLLVLMLTGCGGSSSYDNPGDPEPSGLLRQVTDPAAFEASLKQGLASIAPDESQFDFRGLGFAGVAIPEASSFTGTYTQELNVDELDSVRYDGELLLVAPRRYSYCCFIADALFAPQEPPPAAAIRVLATDPDSGSASLVSEIPLASDTSVQGMYLDGDRMFALTARRFYGSYGELWARPAIWAPEKLGFQVYDLSNPANPRLEVEATVDGVYVESRRIGNTVYIVSRYTPQVEGLHYTVTTAEQKFENDELLNATTLDELLPRISIDGETHALLRPENCYITADDDLADYPVLTSITAVPIDNPSNFVTTCYNESAYGLYVSERALYLAEHRANLSLQKDITRIHKFALAGTRVSYRGSADVDGNVWQGNQSDFRLSEANGNLRVLTSQFSWGSDDFVDHSLYILRETPGRQELEVVSTLPNESRPAEIGKPNEALYGVRFLEDRAYAVTFQQIDPLYVIDLSDATDPYIAGELNVPGVSEFLHPVSDVLLLGVGTETRGGIKLELFDASDITQPLSRGSMIIGGPGSHTEVFQDRHAFTYQADVNGVDRFTISANVYAEDGSYGFLGSSLYLFEVHNKAMPALASLNLVAPVQPPAGDNGPLWVERSRAYIHGDTVYYVRDEEVWSVFWQTPYALNGPY
jgi:uncharacterized secreted protein with C-terminal beta-propeller domain